MSVIVPPDGIVHVGVKERVADTGVLPTMRSDEAILKDTDDTRDVGEGVKISTALWYTSVHG